MLLYGLVSSSGSILYKKEKDLQDSKKYFMREQILNTMDELIAKVLEKNELEIRDVELIGIAAPGAVYEGKIVRSGNLHIQNFELVKELEKKYKIPIYLRNDAKCAALAENQYGSMREYTDGVFLCIGTGIGGAVFYEEKLIQPKRFPGFEFGHMVIEQDGMPCTCGRKGCFEQYASIKALRLKVTQELKLEKTITGKELIQILKKEEYNKQLEPILKNYINFLAIGITNIINIFEPEIVTFGGSFAYYETILLPRLNQRFQQKNECLCFNREGKMPIMMAATLKNDAGMIGATIQ